MTSSNGTSPDSVARGTGITRNVFLRLMAAGAAAAPLALLAGCGGTASTSTGTSVGSSSSAGAQSSPAQATETAAGGSGAQTVTEDQRFNAQTMDAYAVLDGDALVYYNNTRKEIKSAPLDGGGATVLVSDFYGREAGAYLQRIGDRLLYVGSSSITTDCVNTMSLDGTGSQVIYEFEGDGSNGFSYVSPMRTSVIDGRVHVIYGEHQDGGTCGVRVVSFAADGSDVRDEASLDFGAHDSSGINGTSINTACIYGGRLYVTGQSYQRATVWAAALTDSSPTLLYQGEEGERTSVPGDVLFSQGRMLFGVYHFSGGSTVWMSVGLDGSDARAAQDSELDQLGQWEGGAGAARLVTFVVGNTADGRLIWRSFESSTGYYLTDADGANMVELD